MENQKAQIVQRIKDANNVLVTVSKNPSVDQLAAAIGMTLVLNKLGKHGTAVFSGSAPSMIEFLKPEETLEKTTDSLRDFIIALDKSKADKLRYKVEDQHVKIFITPYRTTIGQEDLMFSHGDFNVDVVLALGVHEQQDLDQAITAHGRILHDATIISLNTTGQGEFGSMSLQDPNASSLSEIAADLSTMLKEDVFDQQIATAYLTGIVAETDRFSNEKTRPTTMQVSARLMAAGADQQLVAAKLEEPVQPPEPPPVPPEEEPTHPTGEAAHSSDGALEINHDEAQPKVDPIHIDEHGQFHASPPAETTEPQEHEQAPAEEPQPEATPDENNNDTGPAPGPSRMIMDPPSTSGTLTASDHINQLDPATDPFSLPPVQGPILSHDKQIGEKNPKFDLSQVEVGENAAPTASSVMQQSSGSQETEGSSADEQADQPAAGNELPDTTPQEAPVSTGDTAAGESEPEEPIIQDTQTLNDLEKAVDSPHQAAQEAPSDPANQDVSTDKKLDEIKSVIEDAYSGPSNDQPLEPIAALNASPVHLDFGHDEQPDQGKMPQSQPAKDDDYLDVSKLDESTGLPQDTTASLGDSQTPPPPVPPPMMPPSSSDDDENRLDLPPVTQ